MSNGLFLTLLFNILATRLLLLLLFQSTNVSEHLFLVFFSTCPFNVNVTLVLPRVLFSLWITDMFTRELEWYADQ